GDDTKAHRVMIAASDEGRSRRRAQCRRIEIGEAQAVRGYAVERWRWVDAAEGAGDPEARIVGHNQQHVWCAFGRYDTHWPIGRRLRRVAFDFAFEFLRRWRQLTTFNCRCRAGRAGCAGGLLGPCAVPTQQCGYGDDRDARDPSVCAHLNNLPTMTLTCCMAK